MKMKKIIGALTAKFAVALMAFGLAGGAWGATQAVSLFCTEMTLNVGTTYSGCMLEKSSTYSANYSKRVKSNEIGKVSFGESYTDAIDTDAITVKAIDTGRVALSVTAKAVTQDFETFTINFDGASTTLRVKVIDSSLESDCEAFVANPLTTQSIGSGTYPKSVTDWSIKQGTEDTLANLLASDESTVYVNNYTGDITIPAGKQVALNSTSKARIGTVTNNGTKLSLGVFTASKVVNNTASDLTYVGPSANGSYAGDIENAVGASVQVGQSYNYVVTGKITNRGTLNLNQYSIVDNVDNYGAVVVDMSQATMPTINDTVLMRLGTTLTVEHNKAYLFETNNFVAESGVYLNLTSETGTSSMYTHQKVWTAEVDPDAPPVAKTYVARVGTANDFETFKDAWDYVMEHNSAMYIRLLEDATLDDVLVDTSLLSDLFLVLDGHTLTIGENGGFSFANQWNLTSWTDDPGKIVINGSNLSTRFSVADGGKLTITTSKVTAELGSTVNLSDVIELVYSSGYSIDTSDSNYIVVQKASDVPAVVPVTGIAIDKTEMTLGVGETNTLTATITPANATTNYISWSAGDNYIASIDFPSDSPDLATIKVIGQSAGTAYFHARPLDWGTANPQDYVCCTVTVTRSSNFYQDANDDNLWHVANLAGLQEFRNEVNAGNSFAGKTVVLDVNIDMSSIASWDPIGQDYETIQGGDKLERRFAGTFDGNNKTLSNLTINDNTHNEAGLFGVTGYGSTFKDLTLDSPTVNGRIGVGTLAGKLWASSVVNCHVTGDITVTGYQCVGGLAGSDSYTDITGCSVIGDDKSTSVITGNYVAGIEDGDNIGGLVGMNGPSDPAAQKADQATSNCSVGNLTLRGWRKVGGLSGQSYNRESVYDCSVGDIDIICLADTTFAAAKEETLAFGGMVGIFAVVSDDTKYRHAENSYLEGTVSNVTITCAYDAVNEYAKMGIISGGQRGSTSFVVPTDTQFNVTVSGTNSTSGTKVSDNTDKIYSAYKPPVATVTFQMTDSVGKIVIQGLDDNVHQNVFDTWNDGVNNRPNIRIAFTQTVEPGGTATKPTNTPYYDYNITQPNNGNPKTFTNADSHAYTFDGWATADGELYDFTTPVVSDLVLHPRFSATGATIVIHNEAELRKFAREVELGRKFRAAWSEDQQTVQLAADIALTSAWTPVGGFEGIFDGDNHSISGLVISATADYAGFFSGLNSHTVVKDLTFVSPTVTSSDEYVGVLAGSASSNASTIHPQVSNVNVTGAFSVSGENNVGALIGQVNNGVQIENCSVDGTSAASSTIAGNSASGRPIGGLLGNTIGAVTITDCTVQNVTVTGARKLGGLIGQIQSNSSNAAVTCTGVSVSNVEIVSTAATTFDSALTMGGLVGIFASPFAADSITGTVSDVNMTGPANIADGKVYVMGLVSGGTGDALATAESSMDGAGMTFDVTVSGTNTRTVSNDSIYAGINGGVPVVYVASITRGGVTTEYASAQEALDQVVSGDTLTLYAGDHGTLYIRQNAYVSVGVDVKQQAGEEYGTNDRYRSLAGVTITGQTGATLTNLVIEAGAHYGTNHSNPDYSTTLDSIMEIDNLTISGLTFNLKGGPAIDLASAGNLRLTGLTVDECTVNGTGNFGGAERLLYCTLSPKHLVSRENSPLTGVTKTDVDYTTGLSNLVVTDCTFNNLHQVMEVRNVENLTFTGNDVNDVRNQTIIAVSDAQNPVALKGTVTIANNTIDGTSGDRVFRMDKANATVAITGNTITDYSASDADFIKISTSGNEASYTITGNTITGTTGGLCVNCDKEPGSTDLVAKIGTKYYKTLAAAIAAVPTTGASTTVAMVNNSSGEANVIIAATKNVVLELNGKTVSATAAGDEWHLIVNRGVLTVQDSVGGGAITADGSCSSELSVIYNIGGTLNLVSGTISYTGNWYIGYAVCNSSNAWGVNDDKVAVFNMTGGTISAPSGDAALRVYQNCAAVLNPVSTNHVNITGGTVDNNGIFVDTYLYQSGNTLPEGVYDGSNIDVSINISGDVVFRGLIDLKIRHTYNTKLNIAGGTFENFKLGIRRYEPEWSSAIQYPAYPLVDISGGAFTFKTGSDARIFSSWKLFANYTTEDWADYRDAFKVTGGVFNVDLNDYDTIVFNEGETGVANTDPETVTAYPYTVGEIPVPVAQIVRSGEVFEQYQTLAEAIAAAIDGDTVELLRNVQISGAGEVVINKVGTYVIDGKGFSITPALSTEFAYHRFLFGESGQSYDPARSYTVKDLTISGFTDSAYLVRTEGCSLTLKDCVLENNNLPYYSENDVETHSQNGSRVALATSADLTIDGCVFRNNTTTFQTVDFNTNGGDPNEAAGTFTVDDCLFADNAVTRGSGVIYTLGSTSADNVVSRSTFSGNSVTNTAGAVIYFSGVTDVTGCFFTNNIVNVSADNKCGVFALGSKSAGSSLTGNAFVDNEVSSVGAKATVYGGAKNVDLSGNYWGGTAATTGDGADLYLAKTEGVVYDSFAYSYSLNADNYGVTVVLGKMVAFTGDAPEGVTISEMPANGAYAVGAALPLPTYEADSATFSGWEYMNKTNFVLTADVPSSVTFVATWKVAKTISVITDDSKPDETTPIKVAEDWIAQNVTNEVGEAITDTKQIASALNETADNGLKVWENYVIGQDPSTAVAVGAEQGAEITAMPVSNTLSVQPVDTGFTVEYSLKQVDTNGTEIATVETKPTTDFDIDLSTVESNAYYVMTATIKTDAGAMVSTVTSTNVIGVMKVESAVTTTAVAVPWASYDGTNDISVADIVRTANLTKGDSLKAYDPDSKTYKEWTLGADKTWQPSSTISTSGNESAGNAGAYKVARGSAVWLTRADPSQPIYLVGGAASGTVETKLEAAPSETKSSWNLVGNPKVESVDVKDLLKDEKGDPKTGDQVIVPTAGAPKNYVYVNGAWGYYKTVPYEIDGVKVGVQSVFTTDDTYVPAGAGFWYLNSSKSDDAKINW